MWEPAKQPQISGKKTDLLVPIKTTVRDYKEFGQYLYIFVFIDLNV